MLYKIRRGALLKIDQCLTAQESPLGYWIKHILIVKPPWVFPPSFESPPHPSVRAAVWSLTNGETMINPSFPLHDIFQLILLISKRKEKYLYRSANYFTATIHELKPGFDRDGTKDFGMLKHFSG
ncbi:MAG: hypothetical protein ABI472_24245 [Ginsengibacter sp.]